MKKHIALAVLLLFISKFSVQTEMVSTSAKDKAVTVNLKNVEHGALPKLYEYRLDQNGSLLYRWTINSGGPAWQWYGNPVLDSDT